eukprot:176386-Prymnesium_polylepis.1
MGGSLLANAGEARWSEAGGCGDAARWRARHGGCLRAIQSTPLARAAKTGLAGVAAVFEMIV